MPEQTNKNKNLPFLIRKGEQEEYKMTELLTLLTSGQTATTTGQGGNDIVSILTMLIPLALMVVIFYFLIIRPEQKRSKKMQEMLNNLEVADEVVTTGGIVGRVLRVTDDTVLIETGSDRTKIRVLKSSIAENRTVHDDTESK